MHKRVKAAFQSSRAATPASRGHATSSASPGASQAADADGNAYLEAELRSLERDLAATRLPPVARQSTMPVAFPDGVEVWHTAPDPTVDICFVHGLSGDRDSTWSPPGQAPWPKTMIPPLIKSARVLSYGYDAYVMRMSVASANGLQHHAMNLQRDLANDRARCNASGRPIIFVAHSLGGLVVKQAIILSRNDPAPHLRDIFDHVKGIVFMGTPHNGSWLADWAKLPVSVLGVVKSVNTSLLRVLQTDDQMIGAIQTGFLQLVLELAKSGRPLEVICFVEELPLPGVNLRVVDMKSGSLPGFQTATIHSDHRGMVRFASQEDNGFKRVVAELIRWEKEARTPTTVASQPEPPATASAPSAPIPYRPALSAAPGLQTYASDPYLHEPSVSSWGTAMVGRSASYQEAPPTTYPVSPAAGNPGYPANVYPTSPPIIHPRNPRNLWPEARPSPIPFVNAEPIPPRNQFAEPQRPTMSQASHSPPVFGTSGTFTNHSAAATTEEINNDSKQVTKNTYYGPVSHVRDTYSGAVTRDTYSGSVTNTHNAYASPVTQQTYAGPVTTYTAPVSNYYGGDNPGTTERLASIQLSIAKLKGQDDEEAEPTEEEVAEMQKLTSVCHVLRRMQVGYFMCEGCNAIHNRIHQPKLRFHLRKWMSNSILSFNKTVACANCSNSAKAKLKCETKGCDYTVCISCMFSSQSWRVNPCTCLVLDGSTMSYHCERCHQPIGVSGLEETAMMYWCYECWRGFHFIQLMCRSCYGATDEDHIRHRQQHYFVRAKVIFDPAVPEDDKIRVFCLMCNRRLQGDEHFTHEHPGMEPNADNKRLDYLMTVGPAQKELLRILNYRTCDRTLFLKGSVQHPGPVSRPNNYQKLICTMCMYTLAYNKPATVCVKRGCESALYCASCTETGRVDHHHKGWTYTVMIRKLDDVPVKKTNIACAHCKKVWFSFMFNGMLCGYCKWFAVCSECMVGTSTNGSHELVQWLQHPANPFMACPGRAWFLILRT